MPYGDQTEGLLDIILSANMLLGIQMRKKSEIEKQGFLMWAP